MMMLGRHGGGWQVMISGGKTIDQMFGQNVDPPHYKNFLQSVKERRPPNADIATAHYACVMAHMANIAHRLGNTSLAIDSVTERFIGNDEANLWIQREYRAGFVPSPIK
jgi:hypothetical protein